jgi:hypothetical protein
MASVKKTKKSVRKPRKAADAAHRKVEAAQTPEELLAALPEAHKAHARQVNILANRFIDVIEETNFHPTVALDAMQKLLSIGIGKAMGEQQKELWDFFVSKYYEEVRMLSLLEMFGGLEELKQAAEVVDPAVGTSETEPPVVHMRSPRLPQDEPKND